MSDDHPRDHVILISAQLAVGEAQDNRSRLLSLIPQDTASGPVTVEFSEAGVGFPSAVSLQLCLATATTLRAAGLPALFGPEATRLLAAQSLL